MTLPLDRLRRLANEATPGPWERLAGDEGRRISCEPLRVLGYSSVVARVEGPQSRLHADANLIVALRNNADDLLDAADASERYRAARDECERQFQEAIARVIALQDESERLRTALEKSRDLLSLAPKLMPENAACGHNGDWIGRVLEQVFEAMDAALQPPATRAEGETA